MEQAAASMDQVNSLSENAAPNTESTAAASEEQMEAMGEMAAFARSSSGMATQLQEMTHQFKASFV
ncbi:hypothetical protein NLX67_01075 [Domibacillus sp. A3M-37]|uniref:hypothetical protein n=1 Tax=Domibacillus sp. A3M-37 TaxID=2962037 RepID=UPI0020B6DC4F|nr:hypothetical protein [Domibacillus sp. A3M-37]MCP3760987.1 hypothetical protein [Domibacillus sp. A3M-37]